MDKTVVMVFKQGTRFQEGDVYYNNHRLKTVSKFTYLGVTVSLNGKFCQTQKSLAEQALKALFSLNALFSTVSLDISEKLKLFDAMVLPILNFSSEVWGFHASLDIERVHLKFLKQIAQTCSAAVYGEFGRVPLNVQRKARILKYRFNIMKSPGSLKYKLFQYEVERGGRDNWACQVKKHITDLGLNYLWDDNNVTKSECN